MVIRHGSELDPSEQESYKFYTKIWFWRLQLDYFVNIMKLDMGFWFNPVLY